MKRRGFLVCGVMLLAAAASCSNPDRAADAVWGKQPCEHCKMVLSEPRHAAQMITRDGTRLFFDDLGCMIEYERARAETPKRVWVRNEQGAWIDASTARYEHGARTPMDYGFASSDHGRLSLADVKRQLARGTGGPP
jgi:copper chaperone NosL